MKRFGIRWYHPDFNFLLPHWWFGQVDTRPLSLFRIVFALVMLKDAFYHLFLADVFYSDHGLVTRRVLLDMARDTRFSLMDGIGTSWLAQAFFLVWMAVLIQ